MESILKDLGFELEEEQPHMSGERFLMMKDKQVLMAKDSKGNKVVLKISNKPAGKQEILHEKRVRDLLSSMVFALGKIAFPKEIIFEEKEGYTIWATEFISQDKVFVGHDIEEQFFLILRALSEQESFHATTFEHLKSIEKFFPVFNARDYFQEFSKFMKNIDSHGDKTLIESMRSAYSLLENNKRVIDNYCNYLTHTDFVPHNFRIKAKNIYMLDLGSIQFGNKYEGWARFINYMVIHNPELAQLLVNYVRDNRNKEDVLSLRLMRIYKTGFLIDFYLRSLEKTEGDLKTLTLERINFWHQILRKLLEDEEIEKSFIEEYKRKRDDLRSEEEKDRQREFAVA
jgi:hypothetical protein